MNPTQAQKTAGAVAAFMAILAGGYYVLAPAGSFATYYTIRADAPIAAQVRALADLPGSTVDYRADGHDAGSDYYIARVCAPAILDGGAVGQLPVDVTPVEGAEYSGGPCAAGEKVLTIYESGVAPFACACGPALTETVQLINGTTATRPWVPGTAIRAGMWTAGDAGVWARYPCVALAGYMPPVPAECLP